MNAQIKFKVKVKHNLNSCKFTPFKNNRILMSGGKNFGIAGEG